MFKRMLGLSLIGMREKILGITDAALHHAYLIEGGSEIYEELLSTISSYFPNSSPRINALRAPVFGVLDARTFSKEASEHGTTEAPNVHIIYADAITHESQNALLKTLEEPASNTYIFIIVPRIDRMLHTVHSRCFIVETKSAPPKDEILSAKAFLKSAPHERLAMVEKFVKRNEDEEGESSKRMFDDFLKSLLLEIKNMTAKNNTPSVSESFGVIIEARSMLSQRGVPLKMVAEFTALTMPKEF